MQLDKDTIVNLLRDRGEHEQADKAEQELPDKVDHEEHSGLLQRFGIDPQEALQRVTGGRSIPGL